MVMIIFNHIVFFNVKVSLFFFFIFLNPFQELGALVMCRLNVSDYCFPF